jgi:hypothetical protein
MAPAPRFGALIVTVPPDAFVLWESVMLLPPASTRRVPVMPVSPELFPTFDTPALMEGCPIKDSVADAPFTDWLTVMFEVPIITART